MKRNYVKIALANLVKSKFYSLISISSLTIGMAVCILLLLYLSNELSYDRFYTKSNHIYRLCQEVHPYQAPQVAGLLADNLPEIKQFTRILPRPYNIIAYKDKRFNESKVAYVDANFFKIFSLNFNSGNSETALEQPATVVISEKIAHKYFGDENPIGRVIKVNNENDYVITGVIEEMPQNSHFRFEIFVTLADANTVFGADLMKNWGWENFLVYFEMQDAFSKPELEEKINKLITSNQSPDPNSQLPKFTIQQLKDIHLYSSHFQGDIQPQNSINYILIFSAIGLLILIIACFNYINLLTANAITRVKEIGVRKAFGASRNQLAMQFISESLLVLCISFCLALVIVGVGLPFFNELAGKELSFSVLAKIKIISGMIGAILIIGVLSGWYPAFVLSSYNPVKVLNASRNSGNSKFQLKKILVGAQFTIVIALIACAIVMFRQINFLKHKDLGFNKDFVLLSIVDFVDDQKYNTLKQALMGQSFVSSVSAASRVPSGSLNNVGGVLPEGQTKWIAIPYVHVNCDYFKTMGIDAMQGRLFSDQYKTDGTDAIILNEAAVKQMGIQGNPIGQSVKCNWPKSNRKIIGIVPDFHFESLYDKIKPVVFLIYPSECFELMIKVKQTNVANSIHKITEICQNIYPDQVIEFSFLDERLEQLYQKDRKTFHLMGYFALLAIFLASMGLLGMATFILTSRTKEIGIRKVNGASVSEIMQMLNVGFIKWVAFAFIIATPIAYYGMGRWLENFAYRTNLSWWIFALAGFVTVAIVLITVSWLTYRAARRNPVESLRHE